MMPIREYSASARRSTPILIYSRANSGGSSIVRGVGAQGLPRPGLAALARDDEHHRLKCTSRICGRTQCCSGAPLPSSESFDIRSICECTREWETPVKAEIERNFDATQNRSLDIVERDLEAGDRVGGHVAPVRLFFAAAQFHEREVRPACVRVSLTLGIGRRVQQQLFQ
jgi:hypothetical protein